MSGLSLRNRSPGRTRTSLYLLATIRVLTSTGSGSISSSGLDGLLFGRPSVASSVHQTRIAALSAYVRTGTNWLVSTLRSVALMSVIASTKATMCLHGRSRTL